MAIDLRQEQRRRHPARPPRHRGTVWIVALTLVAVFGVGAVLTVLALQDQPAPAGGVTLTYPEGAFTTEREGGEYIVVPGPVAAYTGTPVPTREG